MSFEIPFIAAELIFAVFWILLAIIRSLRQHRINWKREALLLLMYVNLAVLLRLTFFPMARLNGHVQPLPFDSEQILPLRVNLIPWIHLFYFDTRKDLLLNLIGNVTMFIPSGIILPILYRKLDRFWKVVLVGMGMSLLIEILQLPFYTRASDVDDLILNTIGVAIGYGIYRIFTRRKKNKHE
ncbi:MAG: VanZ family protein [Firmicutes bacterium]|nr:VanZ family protein [Bacillota bacterium]